MWKHFGPSGDGTCTFLWFVTHYQEFGVDEVIEISQEKVLSSFLKKIDKTL